VGIKYKIRFAPKLPSICINQNFQWEIALHISLVFLPKRGSGGEAAEGKGVLGDLLPK